MTHFARRARLRWLSAHACRRDAHDGRVKVTDGKEPGMPRIAAADRRAALIQAALRVIAAHGVAAATTRAIAAEAGMSLASLHYAFTSRDELISYVVREQTRAALTAITAPLVPGGVAETISVALRSYLDIVVADPGRELAMFELSLHSLREQGLRDAARQQYDLYYAAASEVAEAIARHHDVSWRVPVQDVARLVITFTDGLTLGWLTGRDTEATQRVIDFAAISLAALAQPNRPAAPPARPAAPQARPAGRPASQQPEADGVSSVGRRKVDR
jgi:AcrR family transcriptional regulator